VPSSVGREKLLHTQWGSGKRDGSAIGNVGKQESRLT